MSALEQHTVIVTSNVQDARNTSSHFYNVLGKSLDLSQGKWKVAIKKIIYLNSFLNIIDESIDMKEQVKGSILVDSISTSKYDRTSVLYPTNESTFKNMKLKFSNESKDGKRFEGVDLGINIRGSNFPHVSNVRMVAYAIDSKGKKTEMKDPDRPPNYNSSEPIKNIESPYNVRYFPIPSKKDIGKLQIDFSGDLKRSISIPSGYYGTVDSLLETLNKLDLSGVRFEKKDTRIAMHIPENVHSFELKNDLNLTLGFDQTTFTQSAVANHSPQINRGRFAFFIYSNLVHNVRVGDMEAPLMDVISIPKQEFAEIVSLDVVNPLYSDVSLKQVHEIEVMLASDSGELIKFDNSVGNAKTLMVLHFLKVI